jgi:hypothetical protein
METLYKDAGVLSASDGLQEEWDVANKIISFSRAPGWRHQFINIFCKHVVVLPVSDKLQKEWDAAGNIKSLTSTLV